MNGLTTKATYRTSETGRRKRTGGSKAPSHLRMFLGSSGMMKAILLAATGNQFWGDHRRCHHHPHRSARHHSEALQEYRTEQTLESPRSLTCTTATVCRDGKWQTIPACRTGLQHSASGWRQGQCACRQVRWCVQTALGERAHPHWRIEAVSK